MKKELATTDGTLVYEPKKKNLWREMVKCRHIYVILLPALIFYAIFCYGPMYGVILAFKQLDFSKGILRSPWVGLANFEYVFMEPAFKHSIRNTLIISFGKILIGFPVPIILAILFNELREGKYKKALQTVYTFPHFLSWVIVAGFTVCLFSDTGTINSIRQMMGLEKKVVLGNPSVFRGLLYGTDIWKEAGWGTIIYLATIAGIDPCLYEAAEMDGANRFQRIIHVTWPGIKHMVVLMLILAVGGVMNAGFDQIFNLYNAMVYDVADIIDTYVYRTTFQMTPNYGVGVAVGLFKSIINFLLLFTANKVCKLIGGNGIF